MSRIPFHRPVRVLPPALPGNTVTLPAPLQDEQAAGSNGSMWMSLLLPLMSSVSLAAYMIIYRNPLLIALGISFVVFSIGVTVFIRYQMRDATKKSSSRQRGRYLHFLKEVRRAARTVSASQRLAAAWVHPSPKRLWAIAKRGRRVWERRSSDEDFLLVRLGLGRGPLATTIQLGARDDPMAEYDQQTLTAARGLIERFGTVGRQPALADLGAAGVVSLLGPLDQVRALARSLVCQVAVLHAPDDVAIAVCTGDDPGWEWAKWLPHTHEPSATGEAPAAGVVPMVATGFDGLADALDRELRRLVEEQGARRPAGLPVRDRAQVPVRRLVVVLDSYDPKADWAASPVLGALLAGAGPQLGVTVVCLVQAERDEPSRTQLRARVGEDGALVLEGRREELRRPVDGAVADQMDATMAELTARALAPLRLSNEPDRVLSRTVTLPELLGVHDLAEVDSESLWLDPGDERVLRLPIGLTGEGEPLELDLKESAQDGMGPHGLVVGATGSGKSELLRTLVTGLMMTHSPDLLSMVLVDFKGGATFAGVTEMPHVAGLITNLADDLSLVDRVRDALHGEQQRRQKILRDAGNVDSLRDYQMRQAAGHQDVHGRPLQPLPYLLIIVDEFGELLSQRSDFIDLFVQIGRVGRSLGMHLLLATQRLEEGRLRGLESHLSYRICLRTFSVGESRAVIGTPDAYQLPSIPGSAYLKVTESVYERFRVAHISGPYESAEARAARGAAQPAEVVPFGLRVQTEPEEVGDADRAAPALAARTSMEVAIERMGRFGQPVHQVWVPPLPAVVPLDALLGPLSATPDRGWHAGMWPGCGQLTVPVGLIDLPLEQKQQPLVLNFAGQHGHLAIVGSPQSGKSTLLRSLLLAAVLTHTPEEMQFYCIDYGGGSLYPFEGAPHVGGVAGRRDPERTRRTLVEVRREISRREALFHELGIDSAAEFRGLRRAGELPAGVRAPDVLLLVDNWGAVRADVEDADEVVLDVASRGLGVGVHLVLATPRWADIRMNLRDSITGRLELHLTDASESELSRPLAKQMPGATPGRGIAPPGVLYQAVVPRLDGREALDGLGDAQEETLVKVAGAWQGAAAPPIRVLPKLLDRDELDAAGSADSPEPAGVSIGLGDTDLQPVYLDLVGADQHLLVFGDAGSGKSTFLRSWLTGMVERYSAWDVRFMLVDYRRSLLDVVPEAHLGAYAADPVAAAEYAAQMAATLAGRLPPPDISSRELKQREWWSGPELYLVVDDHDLLSGSRESPLSPLVDLLAQAPDIGFHLVLARRVAGAARALMSEPLTSRVRELGSAGLMLSGDPREGALLGDQRAVQLPPGRAVLTRRRAAPELVQVAVWSGDR
jgi:S-DNA-T family DNA segregation ATPase FtsK/SpoIIIE